VTGSDEDHKTMSDGALDFGTVYDRYFSRVYNYVRYRVSSPEAADDITGRVFEQILDKLASFNPDRAPFEAWLFAIARNAVTDSFRSGRFTGDMEPEEMEAVASSEPRPEETLGREEDRRLLLEAGSGLDERSRDVLALKFTSGMNNREIAAMTGLGESNVAVIIYRAVKKLQTDLTAKGMVL